MSDVANVLDRTETFCRRFVAFQSDAQAVAATLWIAHTHAFAAAMCTPRLAIQSAEKQSGKTRLLEVIDLLAKNSKQVAGISPAALFRSIDKGPLTVLIDEVDAIFGPKASADHEDLRSLLNAGYRAGATIPRCVGPKNEVHDFATFAPVALAGIGNLPDTVEDRSILIRLRRRAPHQKVDKLRIRVVTPEAAELNDDLSAVFERLIDSLADHVPEQPRGLSDRAEDVWEPLFAIAECAGGDWPQRAREAAVTLADKGPEDGSVTERLLADIRTVFEDESRLWSTDLCERLAKLEEAPWGNWYGKPLDPRALARLLRHHEIRSDQIKVGDANKRGYYRTAFEDVFAAYLTSDVDSGDSAATAATSLPAFSDNGSRRSGHFGVADTTATDISPLPSKPIQHNGSSAVAAVAVKQPDDDLGAWCSDDIT
jgi:hypothetical protein